MQFDPKVALGPPSAGLTYRFSHLLPYIASQMKKGILFETVYNVSPF